jgi:hypothetical protein
VKGGKRGARRPSVPVVILTGPRRPEASSGCPVPPEGGSRKGHPFSEARRPGRRRRCCVASAPCRSPRRWPLGLVGDLVCATARRPARGRGRHPPWSERLIEGLASAWMMRAGQPESAMTLSAGTQLGPHEILGPIGAGGMGEVYRSRDTRLGRDVAVNEGRAAQDPGLRPREAHQVDPLDVADSSSRPTPPRGRSWERSVTCRRSRSGATP